LEEEYVQVGGGQKMCLKISVLVGVDMRRSQNQQQFTSATKLPSTPFEILTEGLKTRKPALVSFDLSTSCKVEGKSVFGNLVTN
jgi:hypothetical protein